MFYTDISFVNKSLINHKFSETSKIHSISDCLSLCQTETECRSFNVKVNSDVDKGLCEMNNTTAVEHPMDFVDRPGYIYYQET